MDSELVVRAQQGDRGAFTTLATQTHDRLYQLALRILRDDSMADDATQHALVSIWRKLPQLRDPVRFEAWSYRLLVNACNSEARRRRRTMLEITGAASPELAAPDGFASVVDRDQLERGFGRLSVDHRAVLVMHHYFDMPVDAIADVLGVPVGTVKSRLHRAIRQMRIALDADKPARMTARQEVAR